MVHAYQNMVKVPGARDKILSIVAANLKGVETLKRLVVVKPTRHIVRGILLERTPLPTLFYAWSIVIPLFGELENLTLNYSQKIAWNGGRTQHVRADAEKLEEAALVLAEAFDKDYLPELQRIETAADFARRYPWADKSDRLNIRYEMALAHCISGDFGIGKSLLKSIPRLAPSASESSSYSQRLAQLAEMMISKIDDGEPEFRTAVEQLELANIKKYFRGITRAERTAP
jgi:hypothetical protein